MKNSTSKKIKKIYTNWENGNKYDAAKIVRGMSKAELFFLLCRRHEALPVLIMADSNTIYNFEYFIERVLDGYF